MSRRIPRISLIDCLMLIARMSVEQSERKTMSLLPFDAAVEMPRRRAMASATRGEETKSTVCDPDPR